MLIVFFLIAAILSVAAICIVVPAILKGSPDSGVDRRQKNIEIARQRLDELRQTKAGLQIENADAEILQEEIERGLLQDIEHEGRDRVTAKAAAESNVRARRCLAAATALAIPAGAVSLYLYLGSPHLIPERFSVLENAAVADQAASDNDLALPPEQQVLIISQNLESDPENAELWELLGMAYLQSGNYQAAANAFETIRKVSDAAVASMLLEAQAWSFAGTRAANAQAEGLVHQVLSLEPNNMMGLVIAGVVAGQKGEYEVALAYWEQAKALAPPPQRAQIDELLEDAQARLAQAIAAQSGEGKGAVRVQVSLDSEIANQVSLDAAVFVFAHASKGPRMPLAVVKKQVRDLPFEIVLTDEMAMVPNMKLSAFDEVAVVARISKSGSAEASEGDYFGQTEVFRPQEQSSVSVIVSEPVQ